MNYSIAHPADLIKLLQAFRQNKILKSVVYLSNAGQDGSLWGRDERLSGWLGVNCLCVG